MNVIDTDEDEILDETFVTGCYENNPEKHFL